MATTTPTAVSPSAVLDAVRDTTTLAAVDPDVRPLVALVRLAAAWSTDYGPSLDGRQPSAGYVGGGYYMTPGKMTAAELDAATLSAAVEFVRDVTSHYIDEEEENADGYSLRWFLHVSMEVVPDMLPGEQLGAALDRLNEAA